VRTVLSLLSLLGVGCALLWSGAGGETASAVQGLAIPTAAQAATGRRPMLAMRARQPVQPVMVQRPAEGNAARAVEKGPATAMTYPTNRRELIGALLAGGSLLGVVPAQALIPDDDDSELLKKARANRKERLKAEKKAERAFVEEEGLTKSLEQDIAPVQEAVYFLAKAGMSLEKDDVKAAKELFGDSSWVNDLKKGVTKISNDEDSRKASKPLFKEIDDLKKAVDGEQLKPAKKEFVDTVKALKIWLEEAQVTKLIKGV
jgi:hypothetical protein